MVVRAQAGNERGTGWSYTAAAAASVVGELLAGPVTGRDAFDVAGAAEAMAQTPTSTSTPTARTAPGRRYGLNGMSGGNDVRCANTTTVGLLVVS
ncbi:MAG TPA: hypothetical protein VFW50_36250 [Streptosporangiaceae bacterium]|nr:hypothetical protein [Streptosporangiaceae bacterium]